MGLFSYSKLRTPLNELTVGGEKVEDDTDEFSVDNEAENSGEDTDAAEPTTTSDDNAQQEPTEQADEAEEPADDDYSLPEDTGETEEEQPETNEDTTEGDTDTVDDNFEMGDETNTDEGTGEEDGTTTDTVDGEETPEATDTGEQSEGQQLEDQLYDTLTDEQKKMRILQLKLNFKDLYIEIDTIMNGINNISKSDDNVDIIRRLIETLQNIRQYLVDYITTVFDKETYLNNNEIYIKYINIFNTIKNTISELSKAQK